MSDPEHWRGWGGRELEDTLLERGRRRRYCRFKMKKIKRVTKVQYVMRTRQDSV